MTRKATISTERILALFGEGLPRERLTLREIAARAGCSHETARRVLKRHGIVLITTAVSQHCPTCGGPKKVKSKQCRACHWNPPTLKFTCSLPSCGKPFERKRRDFIRSRARLDEDAPVFCSTKCSAANMRSAKTPKIARKTA